MKDSNEMIKELFERREKYYMERQRKMRNFKYVAGPLACCLVVILAVGIPAISHISSPEEDDLLNGDNIQNVESDYPPSMKKEMAPGNIGSTENPDNESQDGEIKTSNEKDKKPDEETDISNATDGVVTEGTSIDIPQKEYHDVPRPGPDSLGDTGNLVPYEPVWGDCYQNEAGKWVVFLTENTPENQKKVLELNPTLTENDIIFQSITFSRSYLESLMISIGQAADENEEFSFVFSIGLRTEKNCVDVYVTTDDEESIAKILAFDTIGGGDAIEIVNINSNVVPKDVQKGPMP